MNAEDIKKECLERWGDCDSKLSKFTEEFDEWIGQFPPNCIEICLCLLKHFEYYSRYSVNKYFDIIHKRLLEEGIDFSDSSIISIVKSKNGNANSSMQFFSEYTHRKAIYDSAIDDIKKKSTCEWKYIEKVVLIDDCSGGGKTFISFIKEHYDMLRSKDIYFVVIHIMVNAKKNILNYAKRNNINVKIISINERDKAFSEQIFKKITKEQSKKNIIEISKKFNITDEYILGFEKSESLMAFYRNTPNNTLGIFHQNTDIYKSIFPRNEKSTPKWKLKSIKEDKIKREKQNYQSAKTGANYE